MADRRTQVYLTESQHRRATKLARDRGTTLAAVVREALDRYLRASVEGEADWDGDPAVELLGCVRRAPSDEALSEEIDRVVYEEGNEWSLPTAPGSSPSSTHRTPTTPMPRRRGVSSPEGGD